MPANPDEVQHPSGLSDEGVPNELAYRSSQPSKLHIPPGVKGYLGLILCCMDVHVNVVLASPNASRVKQKLLLSRIGSGPKNSCGGALTVIIIGVGGVNWWISRVT